MKWTKDMCFALVLAVVLVAGTLAAPVTKTSDVQSPTDSEKSTEVQTQDQDETANELESLLSHNDESQANSPEVPASPVQTQDVSSSQEQQPDPTREQAVDLGLPDGGLPDKREFAENVETESAQYPSLQDLPAYDQELNDNSFYDGVPEVDLSPSAVAEYLLVTKDFDGFSQALDDLVRSGILTAAEVFDYRNTVSWQYERMLDEIENTRRPSLEDLLQVDPLDYLSQAGPVYQDLGMSQDRLPINNQPIDFQDLGIETPDFRDLQIPAFDMTPQQIGGMKAIPFAERRTEITQQLLLAKQQNIDGLLDVILGAYDNQPQQFEETYNTDYLDSFNPNFDLTDSEDLAQLMEYLQGSLDNEEAEEPVVPYSEEEPSNEEVQFPGTTNDVVSELDALQVKEPEAQNTEQVSPVAEEKSNEAPEEDKKTNDTKTKVAETPSS